MKLLILTSGTLPVPAVRGGAIETRVTYLADENEKEGLWDLTILSIADPKAQEASAAYTKTRFLYYSVPEKRLRAAELWNRAAKKLAGKRRQLRLLWYRYPKLYAAARYIRKTGPYDAVILENMTTWVPQLRKRIRDPLIVHLGNDHLNRDSDGSSLAARCLDGIFTNSAYIARCVRTVPETEKLPVIRISQGIDQELFDTSRYTVKDRERIRREYGLSEEDFVFYYAGRIERDKGILELIRAFHRIPGDHVKLVVAGGASPWLSSQRFYQEVTAETDGRISFLGNVPHEKLPELQYASDTAVLPSIWNEPAGQAMMECLRAGLPLITTNRGGIPEYCVPGSCILLEVTERLEDDLYESMRFLMEHPEERKRLREEGLRVGSRYTVYRHYHEIDEGLQKILRHLTAEE